MKPKMTFGQMMELAEANAGDRERLAEALGINANAVRQWHPLGIALPRRHLEVPLGQWVGLTGDEVHAIIRDEHLRRWEVSRARPQRGAAVLPVVPSPKPARGARFSLKQAKRLGVAAFAALTTGMGWGVAEARSHVSQVIHDPSYRTWRFRAMDHPMAA